MNFTDDAHDSVWMDGQATVARQGADSCGTWWFPGSSGWRAPRRSP